MDYLWFTIREGRYGGYDVHGFFEQKSGVLKGQTLKRFIDNYPTRAEAEKAYPQAGGGSSYTDPQVALNHLPGEEDPVPGGMYPDDVEE